MARIVKKCTSENGAVIRGTGLRTLTQYPIMIARRHSCQSVDALILAHARPHTPSIPEDLSVATTPASDAPAP